MLSRRCRFSQPKVRSTTQRRGSTWPGQYLEGVLLCRTAHQFQRPAAHRPSPFHQFAAVGPICPDHLQPGEPAQQLGQRQFGAVPVLYIGGMYRHRQWQAQGVYYDVTFAALHPLSSIVSSGPPFSVVFTDWLSMMAALGLAFRPWACRSAACRAQLARCQAPSRRQVRK